MKSVYLGGPGAARHAPSLSNIQELSAMQWIQAAGDPLPGQWLALIRQIQEGGKSVQARYAGGDDVIPFETLQDLERLT